MSADLRLFPAYLPTQAQAKHTIALSLILPRLLRPLTTERRTLANQVKAGASSRFPANHHLHTQLPEDMDMDDKSHRTLYCRSYDFRIYLR